MIKINNKTYELTTKNYIDIPTKKVQIIIGNTFSEDMNHVKGWKTRRGGDFKRTAPFTIDIYGNIYQHYSPEYQSKYFNINGLDEFIIPILIENEGYLTKDNDNDEYLNYIGNIYNRKEEVVERTWRGQKYWAPYTKPQLESAVKLCKYLCGLFDIKQQALGHNTKYEGIYDFSGVVYKSNYGRDYSDLSPAWDYNTFKNKLELN